VKETDKENKGGCLHKSSDAHKFERCDKDKKPARMCVCVYANQSRKQWSLINC